MDSEYILTNIEPQVIGMKLLLETIIDKIDDNYIFFQKNDETGLFMEIKSLMVLLSASAGYLENMLKSYSKTVENTEFHS